MYLRRKAGFAFVFLILFSVLVLRGSEWRQKAGRVFLGLRDSAAMASPDIDDAMVEQIWSNCGLDVKDIKVARSLDFPNLEGIISDSIKINMKTGLSGKGGIRKAITLLSPELEHMLLDCLSKHTVHFSAFGEDHNRRNRFAEYLESSLGWNPVSRRHLAGQPFQTVAPASAPSPALAPVLAPTPGPGVQPSNYGPAPSSGPAPASSSFPEGYYPSDGLPPESNKPSKNIAPVSPSKHENNNKTSVVIALVLTAAGTSLIGVCLLCCYCGCLRNKDDLENGQRDDKPLLSLSLSDFSGSSNKSFGLASSINKDKFEALSPKMDPGQNGHALSLNSSGESPPSVALSGISSSSIELSNAPNIGPPRLLVSSASAELSDAPNNAPASGLPPSPGMPPPGKQVAPPPPAPPPPLHYLKPGARPPPPPKGALPPRPPPVSRPSPLGPHHSGNAVSVKHLGADTDSTTPKTKLKPFFWDKVSTNPDQSMVWHQIKSGSFQFNEEMIETLFGYSSANKNKSGGKKESSSSDPSTQYIQILDPKKSQNLAISLKALNVKIEEVCDALLEGNELPAELLQTLLRMSPTTDEELKLRLYDGDLSLLGPAEGFLKTLVDIPFAFKRMDALLFMSSLEEDTLNIKESFAALEVACQELRSSRLFLKLLEAVLKTGNRMNDGTFRGGAQAFKLDTLLKLSDVKGIDGKTTLLHFVVQEIIRSEGVRAARMARESGSISSLNSDDSTEESSLDTEDHYRNLGLKVVSGLGDELENVRKAAGLDADSLTCTVANLGQRLVKTKEFLNPDMRSLEEESGFHHSLQCFVEQADADINYLLEEGKRIRSLVKSTTDYFHGNAGKDEGFRLFVIVRDFLGMLDKVCKEVRASPKKVSRTPKTRDNVKMPPVPDPRQRLFPAIRDRRMDSSSSDDEGP